MDFSFIKVENVEERNRLLEQDIRNSGISFQVNKGQLTLILDDQGAYSIYDDGLFNKNFGRFEEIFNRVLKAVFIDYAVEMQKYELKHDEKPPTFDDYGLEHIGLYFEEKLVEVAQLSEQVV